MVSAQHATLGRTFRAIRLDVFAGAITENGDRFFSQFEDYVTADHAKYSIHTSCEGFREDLTIMLDDAPYF